MSSAFKEKGEENGFGIMSLTEVIMKTKRQTSSKSESEDIQLEALKTLFKLDLNRVLTSNRNA